MPKKKNKNRVKTIQLKALKTKKRFKAYKVLQNRNYKRRLRRIKRSRVKSEKSYIENLIETKKVIKVPEKFSIIEDINTVLKFIYQNKKLVEYKRITEFVFDFSNVKKIDDGAATILLSFCHDMSYKHIRVGINYLPLSEEAKLFIQQSGFIKYFSGPLAKTKGDNLNMTLKKGKSTILQKDSASLIHKSMKTIWDEDKRNQKLQGMLIELMTNSVNHAYISNERQKSWYISTKHYAEQNKVEFCFVDNGDGIINTINVKFKDKYFTSNEDLLVRAFAGEFRSRTKLANRGRGLIVVKSNQENMTIKGLKVITNNVFLDFETNTAVKLKTPFSGTFYSWIIDKTCK
jgi:anti-sigma regulatory factor (Ser/Thr protein kinase)